MLAARTKTRTVANVVRGADVRHIATPRVQLAGRVGEEGLVFHVGADD